MSGNGGRSPREVWTGVLRLRRTGPAELAAPRMALVFIVSVLLGYTLLMVINVLSGASGRFLHGAELAGFSVSVILVLGLQVAHSTPGSRRWPARVRSTTLSVQALVTFLPFLWIDWPWIGMAQFLGGSLLLLVAGWKRWVLYGAVGAGVLLVLTLKGEDSATVFYSTYGVLLTSLAIYGISSLSTLTSEVHAARGRLAQLALARERLRVARDLHDLLGYSLSAMTLKSELTYRLLPSSAERAKKEVAEVLEVARQALAQVREVVTGYRGMSLTGEIESAESMLAAAEIEARVEVSIDRLPHEVDAVLAIVVREAITNVLRHSKARWCVLEAATQGGVVRLRVVNDGVENAPDETVRGNGSGLGNLETRLNAIGGSIAAHIEDDEFRLMVEAPVIPSPGLVAKSSSPYRKLLSLFTRPRSDPKKHADQWPLRKAWAIILAVLVTHALVTVVNLIASGVAGIKLLGFVLCLIVVFALQLAHTFLEPRRWWWGLRLLSLSTQAGATYLPLLWIGTPWGSMAGFLVGSILLAVAGPLRWVFAAGMVGLVWLATTGQDLAFAWVAYLVLSSSLTGLIVYGTSLLSGLVAEVHASREKLARMAVAQERLRVARDLNEMLGREVSAMTLKSELAHRLLPRSPEQAREEIEEVLGIARRAVAGVRAVASGYRHISLASEIGSAESTLAAAGIDAQTGTVPEGLSQAADQALAIVLREAVTNLLRHSTARQCLIETALDGEMAELRVANDGVARTSDAEIVREGHGLGSLSSRLAAIGGRLSASVDERGWFHLTARVPTAATVTPDPLDETGAERPGIKAG